MSELLKKHQQNCEAAESLIGNKLYAPAVHCSYYSCIQLITYAFLHEIPGINLVEFQAELDDQGSHNYLRREMKKQLLVLRVSRTQAAEFETALKELKQTRKEADYLDVSISPAESREARRVSEEVNLLIKTTFSIA